jgi:hypothetical protein
LEGGAASSGPGKGETITVAKTEEKKKGCC